MDYDIYLLVFDWLYRKVLEGKEVSLLKIDTSMYTTHSCAEDGAIFQMPGSPTKKIWFCTHVFIEVLQKKTISFANKKVLMIIREKNKAGGPDGIPVNFYKNLLECYQN